MLADLRPPLLVWRNPLIDFFVKEIPLPFPKIGFEVKEWISIVLERYYYRLALVLRKWKQGFLFLRVNE